ncbi:MAG: response regulator transcription factor [Ignavibacteriae bacterium]|nr:response regulator transcription factor [Ignavibacteriota bacterium]
MNKLRILVADDHEGFRRLLSAFLQTQSGVEIVGEARDGAEAIEQTELLHPDLVLMDLQMPKRDGYEATKEIKQSLPETKVVILSIYGDDMYRRQAWQYAADGFIDKSAMKNALKLYLSTELARREAIQAA